MTRPKLRTRSALVVAIVLAALAAFVLVWFQPQKLLQDEAVNEGLPRAAAEPDGGGSGRPDSPGSGPKVEIVASGEFRALAHPVSGRAKVLAVPGDDRYLRFEDFNVENGPDLRVYLSAAEPGSGAGYDDDFVDLGALKGNVGNQNYRIPETVKLAGYETAVIWCRRFSIGFAVAPLTA